MKIIISLLTVFSFSVAGFSQFTIGGGPSLLKAFGVKSPYYGFHILGEYPVDDQTSYYGKLSFYGKQLGLNTLVYGEAIDVINTTPSVIEINSRQSFNYTTIEGGRRYYFGNGYDYGFAAYGGTHLLAAFNQIRQNTDNYDKSKYRLKDGGDTRGNIFNLAFGLSGGIKNDFTWGTLYLDASFDYSIIAVPSNQIAVDGYNQLGSPLLFSFGIGYKKTIY